MAGGQGPRENVRNVPASCRVGFTGFTTAGFQGGTVQALVKFLSNFQRRNLVQKSTVLAPNFDEFQTRLSKMTPECRGPLFFR